MIMTSNAELMEQTLRGIANAIRIKRGIFYDIPMLEMEEEILRIASTTETMIVYAPEIDLQTVSISSSTVTVTAVPENDVYGIIDLTSQDITASVSLE